MTAPTHPFVYRAFGLLIHSDIQLVTLPQLDDDGTCQPQVTIHRLETIPDFPDSPREASEWFRPTAQRIDFYMPNLACFSILNGDTIFVSPVADARPEHLFLFIMGRCMGMLLYQRNHLVMHGSCVCKDGRAILISGASGAGKSTLAAAFVSHGWKLLTDDISMTTVTDSEVIVQSSYPSQKLWQDGISHFNIDPDSRHSLWQLQRKEKFTVTRPDIFAEGTAQLSRFVYLECCPDGEPTVTPVTDFNTVSLWFQNTYRIYMLPKQQRQQCFQQCINAAQMVPMFYVKRTADWNCLDTIYQQLTL